MANLESVLAGIPGLGGFLAKRQMNEQQDDAELQRAVLVQGALAKMQAQQKQRAYESELAGLGPNPTQEQLVRLASLHAGPEKALDIHQKSLDRQATVDAQREGSIAREMMQRELAAARAEASAKQAEMLHEFRMSQARTSEDRAAETARHNKVMEEYRKTQTPQEPLVPVKEADGRVIYVPRSQAAGREVGSRTTDQNIGRQVQQLGRDFEKAGLPQMIPVVERAMQITPEQAKFITGPGGMLPDRSLPQDVREARQALQKLFNITLKDRSGAAVTYQELERLKAEFGSGLIKHPDQLLTAIKEARNIVESHYTGVGASYGKEALDAYNTNLEAIGGTPFRVGGQSTRLTPTQPRTPQPPQSGLPTVMNEAEYNALPSGTVYVAPDGKTKRKR
jgi:hypothetical protein